MVVLGHVMYTVGPIAEMVVKVELVVEHLDKVVDMVILWVTQLYLQIIILIIK